MCRPGPGSAFRDSAVSHVLFSVIMGHNDSKNDDLSSRLRPYAAAEPRVRPGSLLIVTVMWDWCVKKSPWWESNL